MKYIVALGMTVLTALVWLQVISGLGAEGRVYQELVTQASGYEERGLYVKAIDTYAKAYEAADERRKYEVALKRLECIKTLGDLDSYEAYCKEMIQAYPENPECYRLLFACYQDSEASVMIPFLKDAMARFPEESQYKEAYLGLEKQYTQISRGYEEMSDWLDGYLLAITHVSVEEADDVAESEENRENEKTQTGTESGSTLKKEYRILGADGEVQAEGLYYEELSMTDAYTYEFLVKDEKNRWKMINTKGYEMENNPDISFDALGPLHEGYAWCIADGAYHLINGSMAVSPMNFTWIGTFCEGYSAVKMQEKWALYAAEKMEACTEYAYDDIKVDTWQRAYKNGRFFGKTGAGYQMFDAKGKAVTKDVYEDAKPFLSPQPTAVMQGGRWGFALSDGQMYIAPEYEDAKPFSNGYAAVKKEGKWGYINKDNVLVIEPQYTDAGSFSDFGIAPVQNENGYWDFVQMDTIRYQ